MQMILQPTFYPLRLLRGVEKGVTPRTRSPRVWPRDKECDQTTLHLCRTLMLFQGDSQARYCIWSSTQPREVEGHSPHFITGETEAQNSQMIGGQGHSSWWQFIIIIIILNSHLENILTPYRFTYSNTRWLSGLSRKDACYKLVAQSIVSWGKQAGFMPGR